MANTRVLIIGLLLLPVVLIGCSSEGSSDGTAGTIITTTSQPTAAATGKSTVMATPTPSPAPTSVPAPVNCGKLTTLPGGTPQGNPTPAESCFATAFQSCYTASLEYIFSGIDSTTDYQMSIRVGNGTCSIAVHEHFTSASGSTPTNRTSDYSCATIGQQSGKYVVSQCGSNPTIGLP